MTSTDKTPKIIALETVYALEGYMDSVTFVILFNTIGHFPTACLSKFCCAELIILFAHNGFDIEKSLCVEILTNSPKSVMIFILKSWKTLGSHVVHISISNTTRLSRIFGLQHNQR